MASLWRRPLQFREIFFSLFSQLVLVNMDTTTNKEREVHDPCHSATTITWFQKIASDTWDTNSRQNEKELYYTLLQCQVSYLHICIMLIINTCLWTTDWCLCCEAAIQSYSLSIVLYCSFLISPLFHNVTGRKVKNVLHNSPEPSWYVQTACFVQQSVQNNKIIYLQSQKTKLLSL